MMSNSLLGRVEAGPQVRSALAALADLHERTSGRSQHAVVLTGFDPLDELLAGGIRPGELMLLGGKPGVGKTIACLQAARAMAQQGIVVVYLCYEHDDVTLLTRLLLCELGEIVSTEPAALASTGELQARLRDVAAGTITLTEAVESDALLEMARRRLAMLRRPPHLRDRIGSPHQRSRTSARSPGSYEGQPVALFVDYVQKVPVFPTVPVEAERVGRVIEGLKELALDQKLVVVAVAAADQGGLDARRLHLRHFRGSTALAYEADAIVVLNEKLDRGLESALRPLTDPGRGVPTPGRVLRGEEPQRHPGRQPRVREGLRPLPLPPAWSLGVRAAVDGRIDRAMNLGHAPLALACGSAALLVAPWLTRLIQRAIAQRSPEARHGKHAQAAVAAVTALGFAATALHFGPRAELPVYLFLIAALVVLSFVDLATKTLPRRLVHMALAVGIVLLTPIAVFMGEPQRVLWATVGGAGRLRRSHCAAHRSAGGLGYGDVRLGAMLGWFVAWEGLRHVPVGLFLAFVSSAVVGLALIASGRASRRTAIPFGPFLAIGGVLALLGGSLSAASARSSFTLEQGDVTAAGGVA